MVSKKSSRRKEQRRTKRTKAARQRSSVEIEPAKLRRINEVDSTVGPSIAQDMLAGIRSYRKLAKRHHVGFTIISKIKAILFTEEKPLAQVAVALTTDDFEDTAGEKAD